MATRIQLRRDTAINWYNANPILADGELGIEKDTQYYKLGDGVTAWRALAYFSLKEINTTTNLVLSVTADPAAPDDGKMSLYSKKISGRTMLKMLTASGRNFPLQPSFFQNNITIINTNNTTTITSIGNAVTSTGTISHPNPTEKYGFMANFLSASTANATAGTGNTTLLWTRGAALDSANGFFFNARIGLPDSSYEHLGSAATGTRIFVGLTNRTMAQSVESDNPTGHYAGFFRRSIFGGAQDTNWKFATKNNVTLDLQDTGCPFVADHVYDTYIFCKITGTELFWRIDDMTDGTSYEGSTGTYLPETNIWMRGGFQVFTANAVSRNIRMQRVYIESDR